MAGTPPATWRYPTYNRQVNLGAEQHADRTQLQSVIAEMDDMVTGLHNKLVATVERVRCLQEHHVYDRDVTRA